MRILITGYTSRMVGSPRIQRDYLTFVVLLEEILKEMGHTVERREVAMGEKLQYVYDYAFCGVAPLSSISASRIPETHYVMAQLPTNHAIYADDWSFCGFGKSVRYTLDKWEKFCEYKNFVYEKKILDATLEHLTTMCTVKNAGLNAPVLAPMFLWGNHDLLLQDNFVANLHTVDPSPWVLYPTINTWSKFSRKKRWCMAALSDHTHWIKKQGFSFPVWYIGNRRMEPGLILNERETIQEFANSFGIISAGYPSSGSGWWRTRYLNAVWAEVPVYSDRLDAELMGEAYQGKAWTFEQEEGLPSWDDRVASQRDWLNSHTGSKEQTMQTLSELMKK